MKAVIYEKYGPPEVLHLVDVEKPVPRDDEVLIKVYASTVTPMDWRFRKGTTLIARFMTGLRKPRSPILGVEFSGTVEEVGPKVDLLQPGDAVFGGGGTGAHTEYVCKTQEQVVRKPHAISPEEAAGLMFGGGTALRFLRDYGHIREGHRVLVNGASGGVGTFGVQIAKAYGAHVTGVCSTGNLELVESLGADEVVDYTRQDFTRSGRTYDIIFDAVGKRSYSQCRNSLSPTGIYLSTVITIPLLLQMLVTSPGTGKKARTGMPPPTRDDLAALATLAGEGMLRTVIDRSYSLDEVVEAHRYAEAGHAKGKVLLTIQG